MSLLSSLVSPLLSFDADANPPDTILSSAPHLASREGHSACTSTRTVLGPYNPRDDPLLTLPSYASSATVSTLQPDIAPRRQDP